MVTLEMARFGPVTDAWGAARFNMEVSTEQQKVFKRLGVMAESPPAIKSASGVIGVKAMDQ